MLASWTDTPRSAARSPPPSTTPARRSSANRDTNTSRHTSPGSKPKGLRAVRIEDPGPELPTLERWTEAAARTLEAMREGADIIYQGSLFDGTKANGAPPDRARLDANQADNLWVGRPDFLRKVDAPSDLGPWSYEVTDAKLAREAKGGALLQLCVYSELLERMQGKAPEYAHLALGGPAPATPSESLAPTRNRAPNRDLPPRQLHGLEQTDSVTAVRSGSVRELRRY